MAVHCCRCSRCAWPKRCLLFAAIAILITIWHTTICTFATSLCSVFARLVLCHRKQSAWLSGKSHSLCPHGHPTQHYLRGRGSSRAFCGCVVQPALCDARHCGCCCSRRYNSRCNIKTHSLVLPAHAVSFSRCHQHTSIVTQKTAYDSTNPNGFVLSEADILYVVHVSKGGDDEDTWSAGGPVQPDLRYRHAHIHGHPLHPLSHTQPGVGTLPTQGGGAGSRQRLAAERHDRVD